MSSTDEEFGKQVGKMLDCVKAVESWERENGEKLDGKPRAIPCPSCLAMDALRFVRTEHHLYLECATPGCMGKARANCRGRRRRVLR